MFRVQRVVLWGEKEREGGRGTGEGGFVRYGLCTLIASKLHDNKHTNTPTHTNTHYTKQHTTTHNNTQQHTATRNNTHIRTQQHIHIPRRMVFGSSPTRDAICSAGLVAQMMLGSSCCSAYRSTNLAERCPGLSETEKWERRGERENTLIHTVATALVVASTLLCLSVSVSVSASASASVSASVSVSVSVSASVSVSVSALCSLLFHSFSLSLLLSSLVPWSTARPRPRRCH